MVDINTGLDCSVGDERERESRDNTQQWREGGATGWRLQSLTHCLVGRR